MIPRNLIKRQQNIFKRSFNTFESSGFIYLSAQLILPPYGVVTLDILTPNLTQFGYIQTQITQSKTN